MTDAKPSLVRALAVTLLVPIAYELAQKLPAPGLDEGVLRGMGTSNLNVFALGIMPAISAYTLVELFAVLRPRWQSRRHTAEGRRKLERAVAILIPVLSIFQAFGVVMYLRGLDGQRFVNDVFVGDGGRWLFGVTIVAGACFATLLARLIGRQGLVNGYVILFTTDALVELGARLLANWETFAGPNDFVSAARLALGIRPALADGEGETLGSGSLMILVGSLLVAAVATAFALGRGPREKIPTNRIWVPSSSLYPFWAGPALLALPSTLVPLSVPGARALAMALSDSTTSLVFLLVVAVVGALGLGSLLNAGETLAETWNRLLGSANGRRRTTPVEAEAQARKALVPTALLMVSLVLAEDAAYRAGALGSVRTFVVVPLLVAFAIDGAHAIAARRELGGLVCVREERRPYAMAAICAALGERGIEARDVDTAQLVLVHPLGGYAPGRIMVRPEDAPRATKLLDDLLDGDLSQEDETARTDETPPVASPSWQKRTVGLAVSTVGALLLLGLAVYLPRRVEPAAKKATLEVVAVNDVANPFEGIGTDGLPPGVSISIENVYDGVGKYVRYATTLPRQGENWEQTRTRLATWLGTLRLPDDSQFAFGDYRVPDPDTQLERVGVRSYVVRGKPILTNPDVTSAKARTDESSQAYIAVLLTPEAGERFRQFTAANKRRRIAILLDGKVESAPIIQQEIAGGSISITFGQGNANPLKEARQLARGLGGR